MKFRTLIFNQVDGPPPDFILKNLLDLSYSHTIGYGFNLVDNFESFSEWVFIKNFQTKALKYNQIDDSIESFQIEFIKKIQFSIYNSQNRILCKCGVDDNSRLLSALKKVFDFNISIHPIVRLPFEVLISFDANNINYLIDEVTVRNFKIDDGLVGNVNIEVISDRRLIDDIVKAYAFDITKLRLKIYFNDIVFFVLINSNGVHRISDNIVIDEEIIGKILNYIYY